MGDAKDRKAAWRRCDRCPAPQAAFEATFTTTLAHRRERDARALFQSRPNLNYARRLGPGARPVGGNTGTPAGHWTAFSSAALITFVRVSRGPGLTTSSRHEDAAGNSVAARGGNKSRGLLMVQQGGRERRVLRASRSAVPSGTCTVPSAFRRAWRPARWRKTFPGIAVARFIDTHANQAPQ